MKKQIDFFYEIKEIDEQIRLLLIKLNDLTNIRNEMNKRMWQRRAKARGYHLK